MNIVFWISGGVAVAGAVMVVTRRNAVHALLYLLVTLLALALVFYALGAPLAAGLEVIVYAGAILVLFVFVIMMLNQGPHTAEQERMWLAPSVWIGPAVLSAILLAGVIILLSGTASQPVGLERIGPKETGLLLYGPYALAVPLSGFLLMAGLVAACHLGRRSAPTDKAGGGVK